MSNLALKLVEGNKEVRDKFISKTEVLDKVKEIAALPDGYIESKKVADFFETSSQSIRMIVSRHKEEFKTDEILKLKGAELKEYKESLKSQGVTLLATAHLTLFTRKGVLRVGMLLTTSPVAEKVRDYLLQLEKQATQDQKETALEFTGKWTDEIDNFILEELKDYAHNGVPMKKAMKKVADQLGVKETKLKNRWYLKTSGKEPLRNRLDEETKKSIASLSHLKLVDNANAQEEQETKKVEEAVSFPMEEFKGYFSTMNEQMKHLQEQNEKLHKGMGSMWRSIEGLVEENKEIKASVQQLVDDIANIKENVDYRNNKDINTLKRKAKVLNEKLKESKQDNDELLKFIGKSSVMSKTFIEETEAKKEEPKFKMERNGNLVKA